MEVRGANLIKKNFYGHIIITEIILHLLEQINGRTDKERMNISNMKHVCEESSKKIKGTVSADLKCLYRTQYKISLQQPSTQ